MVPCRNMMTQVLSLTYRCVLDNLFNQWRTWSGNAQQLVGVLLKVEQQLGIQDLEVNPNERLIRHYVSLGILKRPRREGKEAIYKFEHLIAYLVARTLARDGWPLAKVKEQLEALSEEELYRYIELSPGASVNVRSAKDLITEYKAKSRRADHMANSRSESSLNDSKTAFSADDSTRQSAYLTKKKLEDQATLIALGNATGNAKQTEILEIELTEWCRLLIDRLQLSKMPPETPELLGKAVERFLSRELHRQRGMYK